jgi:DNA invertase Pin-like site-specific DNA recombinase
MSNMTELVSARPAIERMKAPGKASEHICHFGPAIPESRKVVLWLRVSIPSNKAHLDSQETELRNIATKLGVEVVGVFSNVGSGVFKQPEYCSEHGHADRISNAAASARQHGAWLLATETDRLVRSPFYLKRSQVNARDCDLKELQYWAYQVTLATLQHPDLSMSQSRSHQTKRGQRTSGKKGGRPPKHQPGYMALRRKKQEPRVLQLNGQGVSLAEIVKLTGVPRRTVSRWIASHQ